MYAEWIIRSNGLPREGQRIEFLLESRSVAMEGSYTRHAFHSRWAEYDVDRVRSWRNLTQTRDLAFPAWKQAERVLSSASCPDQRRLTSPAGGIAHAG